MELEFSNGNIMGVMDNYPNGQSSLIWSAKSQSVFNSHGMNGAWGDNPTAPDTMLTFGTSFSINSWKGSGELFRIRVHPSDTGSIRFDTLTSWLTPELRFVEVYDPGGEVQGVPTVRSVIHVPPQPGTVRFRISTSSGTDTLYYGVPGTIYFDVDAMGNELAGLVYVLDWEFSNGNIIGPISESSGTINFSPQATSAFESIAVNPVFGHGTNPDTTLMGLTSFDTEFYSGSGWVWSVTFNPTDTGTIDVDTMFLITGDVTDALDGNGSSLPWDFIPGRVVVVPCPFDMMGDVNADDVITSADVIYQINFQFKGGPAPLPERSVGDVNCSGDFSAADIIRLVNFVFKSGAPPCACIVRRI